MNGDVFVGTFVGTERQGFGVYYYVNKGSKLEGEWVRCPAGSVTDRPARPVRGQASQPSSSEAVAAACAPHATAMAPKPCRLPRLAALADCLAHAAGGAARRPGAVRHDAEHDCR